MNSCSLTIFSIVLSCVLAPIAHGTVPCAIAMKDLNATTCPFNGSGVILKDLSNFCDINSMEELENGNTLTYFALLKSLNTLTPDEWKVLKTVAPLTSFKNERLENNVLVPNLDKETPLDALRDEPEIGRFKAIVSKSSYLMPGVYAKDITPELLVSVKYQEGCQPGFPRKTTVLAVDQSKYPTTFRISKELFKVFLVPFRLTVQMKASDIEDQRILKQLADLDEGAPITKAILMERTKSDISHTDGSKVVKSLQIYRDVKGGVLVANYTVVLNDQLPGGLSSLVAYFGSKNASDESAETANRTRTYLSENRPTRVKRGK